MYASLSYVSMTGDSPLDSSLLSSLIDLSVVLNNPLGSFDDLELLNKVGETFALTPVKPLNGPEDIFELWL